MTAREIIMGIMHATAEDPAMLDRELIVHGERGQIGPAALYITHDPEDGAAYLHLDLDAAGDAEETAGGEAVQQ